MKKFTHSSSLFLMLLFLMASLAFQSCEQQNKESDLTIIQESNATPKTPCEVSNDPPNECETTRCICPAYFELQDIQGPSSYVTFRKIGQQVSPECYSFDTPGTFCLELEGGGLNESTGTTYQVVLNGIAAESPRATITLIGSCHANLELIDHEMVYFEPSSNLLFTQWACISESVFEVE